MADARWIPQVTPGTFQLMAQPPHLRPIFCLYHLLQLSHLRTRRLYGQIHDLLRQCQSSYFNQTVYFNTVECSLTQFFSPDRLWPVPPLPLEHPTLIVPSWLPVGPFATVCSDVCPCSLADSPSRWPLRPGSVSVLPHSRLAPAPRSPN